MAFASGNVDEITRQCLLRLAIDFRIERPSEHVGKNLMLGRISGAFVAGG
jgi:hypothetical protein